MIQIGNHLPFAVLWFTELLFCYIALFGMMRFFQQSGLYVFISVAVIAANIQVIKPVFFPFFEAPIPLGTTLISATYLACDILAEYYGSEDARRGVFIAFSASLMFIVFMMITLWFKPLGVSDAARFNLMESLAAQPALITLFSPQPLLLLSSLSSFLLSQLFDVSIFMHIRRLTAKRWLWLRSLVSTWLSALLDSFVFNVLAFRLLALHPVDWHTLIFGFIPGTYAVRMLVSFLDTPMIYWAKKYCKA